MRRWCVAVYALVLLCSLPRIGAQALGFTLIAPNEDELLLCSLNVDRELLSQELETYVTERGLFIPLGTVCRLIECGLDVDPGRGTASGYLWDEAHAFSLDMVSRSVRVAGERGLYDEARIVAHPDDIYVEVSLLSEWFGIPIQADRYDAAVVLLPRTKLPIQLRLEREQRGGKTTRYGVEERSYFPRAANPYRFLDGFNLDFSVGASLYSSSSGNGVSLSGPTYSALLTGDLLWMSGSLSVAGKLDGSNFVPTSLYGVLRRVDPDGKLFGSLGGTEFSIGKVSAVLPSLLGASASGYGASVGNYALTSPSYFDLQTLSGPLLSGWDVELYRNDSYLDFRKADASGTYTFADIPLVFGTNLLRLEFHGPLGQKKTEEHIYNVGSNMTPPGTLSYRASATAEEEGGQFALQTTYGLSKYLTFSSSALSGVFPDGRNLHVQAGMAGYFSRLQFDVSAAYDARHSGFAGDLGLRTQLLGLGLSWRGTYYDDKWEKANASSSDPPYQTRSVLRVDGLSLKMDKFYASLSSSWISTLYREGCRYDLFALRNYNSYRAIRLRNELNLSRHYYGPSSQVLYADGSTTANARIGEVDLEASCGYDIYPEAAIESLSFSAEAGPFLSVKVSGAATYSLSSDLLSASISLYRDVSPLRLGLTGTWTTRNAFSVSLSISTSIAFDSKSGAIAVDSRSGAGQGSIAARVYLDANYNRKWDKGEDALKDVGFIVNDSGAESLTDAKGNAFLRGLSANLPLNVEVDETTLEDLLLVPADKGLSCVLHPGTAARLDFPVWITGEVSGTIWAVEGGVRRELAGARVELLDSSGAVIGSVRSAYDGYYVFSALKVGPYTVRITKKSADEKVAYITRVVNIPQNGGYVDGADLEYRPFDDTSETGAGGCAGQ